MTPALVRRVSDAIGSGLLVVLDKVERCARGHVRTPATTYVSPDGKRRCWTCRRSWQKAGVPRGPRPPKSTCPQGHPKAGANLYVDPRGNRHCKTCRNEANRRHRTKEIAS